MARVGKFLGLISPVLALGVAALMLFGSSYSYQSSDSEGNVSSGTVTAFRYALEEGDAAWFWWSGFIIVVCLIAAIAALFGRVAPIWVCAMGLWVLSVLGIMSIGLLVLPLAMTLFASAILLTAARHRREIV